MKAALLLILVLTCFSASAKTNPIKNPYYREMSAKQFVLNKVTYIPLEGGVRFPNSAWGCIGYAKEGLVYVMMSDHISNSAIYEYNTRTDKLYCLGTVTQNLHLKTWIERQPKVHTPIMQHPRTGLMYFGTDAGDRSEDAGPDHAVEGYIGGMLVSLNPISKELENLGIAEQHAGIKYVLIDGQNDFIYMNTSRETYFVKYEMKNDRFVTLGRVNGYEVPRTLFFDKWNNVYNSTETGYLVRYNVRKDTLEYLNTQYPGGDYHGASQVAYGPNLDYVWITLNYTAMLLKYTPEENGPGRLDSIASFSEGKGVGARNLSVSGKKLCLILTSREAAEAAGDTTFKTFAILKVYDTETNKVIKQVKLYEGIASCFGHPISDDKGNCYVVGFGGGSEPEDGISTRKPVGYLIKYNPNDL
jgi:hypothetical protein